MHVKRRSKIAHCNRAKEYIDKKIEAFDKRLLETLLTITLSIGTAIIVVLLATK